MSEKRAGARLGVIRKLNVWYWLSFASEISPATNSGSRFRCQRCSLLIYPVVPESWKIKLLRWKFNRYPAYRQSGARVVRISEDFREITVRLPLNRSTRNLHGTIYGGAMYAAVDPLHAVIVASHLGPDYHVWMKSAQIDFKRPGRSDLFAHARVTQHELDEIRTALEHAPKLDRVFALNLADRHGNVSAHVRLTIHIKRRGPHEPRMDDVVFAKPA